ncbi:RNA polymerase sigma factor, partial [Streptomyces bottropensis]|uniref:RNA polymerase sigma factor n=1 Tax=Streptomyces bottropensis TaxID=42235 RepID=UPI003685D23F
MRSVRAPLHEVDEEGLVRLVAKGDRAAFQELYRRMSPWLAVRPRRRCGDEQIVAEVMQETYLAVWRAAGGSAVGWLWTIAA